MPASGRRPPAEPPSTHVRSLAPVATPAVEPSSQPQLVALRSTAGVAVVVATALSSMVASFNASVVVVAVPAIERDLQAGVSGVQWVVTGYLLTAASLLLLAGAVIDHFGRRRSLIAALFVLLLASVLCAAAPTTGVLVAARLFQGSGAALLGPSALSLLNGTLRVDQRARGIGIWAGLATFGMTLGPYAAGWLVDHSSWRYLFLLNVPLVLAALWVLRHVPAVEHPRSPLALDVAGGALAVAGLGGVMYALTAGPTHGWLTGSVLISALLGVSCLAALVPIENRQQSPMLHLSLFRVRQFAAINLTTLLLYGALAAAAYLIALQTQLRLGYSATAAGAALIPASVVFFVLSPLVGGLVARVGPRRLMFGGMVAISSGFFWLAGLEPGDSYASDLLPGALLWGLGLGLAVAPLTAGVLASVGDDELGQASAVNDAAARVGGLVVIALVPALLGVGHDGLDQALATGYRPAMVVVGGLSLVAAAVAGLFVSDHSTGPRQMSPLPDIHSCPVPVPDQHQPTPEKP